MIQMVSSHIYIFCFSKLVHVPHIYIYSIGPMPKSIEYHLFGQFSKFSEMPRQFLPDMSSLWPRHIQLAGHVRLRARACPGLGFLAYIRGLSTNLRILGLFFSSTSSLVVAKGSLGDFWSSPPNPFSFLEI
jgi:hypothetical protein